MNKIKQYLPLITIIAVAALAACAISIYESWSMERFMQLFMGIFLVQFSVLKLFDLSGFQKGFAKYDLLAKHKHGKYYGYIYPFIELLLALGYLANGGPAGPGWVYLLTIIVMGFGAIGVILALKKGLDINCACLGTSLKVPLSTVALTENLTMAIMASLHFIQI